MILINGINNKVKKKPKKITQNLEKKSIREEPQN